jgi:hypothetical protein
VRCAWFALAATIASGAEARAVHIEHTPPACIVAEKAPMLVACLTPRASRADLRVLFRADDGAWYAAPLRFEMPCHRGALPRPSAGTPAISYMFEAREGGVTARSAEYQVPVAKACTGPAAPIATARVSWEAPPGAPRTPPGFEGSRVRSAGSGPPATVATAPEAPALPPPPAKARATPVAPAPASVKADEGGGGGHALRNVAIVVGGAAAAGGAALALRSDDPGAPATTMGSGLPSTGVAGTYVGTETITYSSSCTGTDDVVLNLQASASSVSGVISFTVRTCSCCSAGRGANPVSGFLSDTRIDLTTPIGFVYSGSFAGNRLSGSLSAPGGVSGTWTVEKR